MTWLNRINRPGGTMPRSRISYRDYTAPSPSTRIVRDDFWMFIFERVRSGHGPEGWVEPRMSGGFHLQFIHADYLEAHSTGMIDLLDPTLLAGEYPKRVCGFYFHIIGLEAPTTHRVSFRLQGSTEVEAVDVVVSNDRYYYFGVLVDRHFTPGFLEREEYASRVYMLESTHDNQNAFDTVDVKGSGNFEELIIEADDPDHRLFIDDLVIYMSCFQYSFFPRPAPILAE